MKFVFEANQDYQLEAIKSAVDVFEGQDKGNLPYEVDLLLGTANQLTIDPDRILANCKKVQAANELPKSETLEFMKLSNGEVVGEFPNFTIEMETGTGKTYVYLRTIYELNKIYGFKKFIIVVPGIAIREGVMKSLEITHEHFQTLYSFEPIQFAIYDSSKTSSLRNFALSDSIEVLVIGIDSFAKDSEEAGENKRRSRGNVINQRREQGIKPIEHIQNSNPVVILDEPQNLETDKRKAAIARLNPLCTFRYSATHKNTYNLIYKLDPVRAYEKGLVKQISVDSVVEDKDANQSFIELEGFTSAKRSVSAKVTIFVVQATGTKKKTISIKNGDDLFEKSGNNEIYRNEFKVNEIDSGEGLIRFANDVTVRLGNPHGVLTEEILKLQIDQTVKNHFEKERRYRDRGIKVLSVLFVDEVTLFARVG